MKFTDGQWLLQPGVTAHYAAEVHSIASEGNKLVVLASVRPILDLLLTDLAELRIDGALHGLREERPGRRNY